MEYENENVIFAYTLAEATADGVVQRLGWAQGKPLMGTAAIVQDVPAQEREGLFQDFLKWQRETEPGLAEEDRMVVATASNGETVWVIDDGAAITLLSPSDDESYREERDDEGASAPDDGGLWDWTWF